MGMSPWDSNLCVCSYMNTAALPISGLALPCGCVRRGNPMDKSGEDTIPAVAWGHCRLRTEPRSTWCFCSGCSSREAAVRESFPMWETDLTRIDSQSCRCRGKATSGRCWGDQDSVALGVRTRHGDPKRAGRAFAADD